MNSMPVVLICDDNFIMQTAVTLVSMQKNKLKSSIYDICIITVQCSKENIEKLLKLQTKNFNIRIIEYENRYQNPDFEHEHVSTAALIKFDLANILHNLNKVLYLDGDIIVKGDLNFLFNQDIEGYYLAAVKDMKFALINRDPEKNYFNSGVMLLNLDKIRKEIPFDKFIQTRIKMPNRFQDQDTLNKIFYGSVKFLSVNYNFLTRYLDFFNNEQIKQFYGIEKVNPVIYHYASQFKPWDYKDIRCFKLWYKYFKLSPFCSIKLNLQKLHPEKSFIKNIFSVTNDNNCHKIFSILGVKFKIKNKRKILERNLRGSINSLSKRIKFIYDHGINKEKIQYFINNFSCSGVTDEKREQKIIVSLTSYPERFYDIHYTLYSLLNQTLKPDEVILYLTEEQFPKGENDIGSNILNLKKNGLKIKFYNKNIKSYTKLIPALKEYPNDIIITVDDDIYYDKTMVENLYNTYLEQKTIIANRCHKVKIDNGQFAPYLSWRKEIFEYLGHTSYFNFLTGVGGVLYPPHSLHKDVFNEDLFMQLSPSADDIYFWVMAVLNRTKISISKNKMNELVYTNPERELALIDDGTLWQKNKQGNDIQLNSLTEYYPKLIEILNEEQESLIAK